MNFKSTIGFAREAAATGAVSAAKSIMAYVKQLVTELQVVDSVVDTLNASKLCYLGTVSTYTNTTQFKASDLLGAFGNDFFEDWYIYVAWDLGAAGAAPQGESQPCSAYASADGTFTHTAFTSPLEVGDKIILIHPSLARTLTLGELADASATGAVTTTDTVMAYIKQIVTNTYRLGETACADVSDPVDMTTEVVDNSILANILTDDGDTSVYDRRTMSLEALSIATAATVAGRYCTKATTVDLNQIAGNYDLGTATTQNVIIQDVICRLPNVNVSDDATITGISIQSNDATPQVYMTATEGLKANLTAESQPGNWHGAEMLVVGKKIQLTIYGGAADAATVCNIVIGFRPVVAGGTLG